MIISATVGLNSDVLANALPRAIDNAKRTWLASVKVHVMQVQPADGKPAYADAFCLAMPFLFRVELIGNVRDAGIVHVLDNARLAKGCAKLMAINPQAFGRIAAKKGTAADCDSLLQLALFGYERY